jgi:2-amino-4-hydroxy-6-hydroxymethyldihydropteridine diphosphokinase
MPAEVFIAMGSNLGDRHAHLRAAGEQLRTDPQFDALEFSPIYETDPVGGPPGQDRYLNAVVRAKCSAPPIETLYILRGIERRLGRSREQRWGARTIDLDLLLHGHSDLNTPELVIPHPRMHLRRFVLQPLADLAPDLVHPTTGRTVRELLESLPPAGDLCRRLPRAECIA